jgi:hypothetical protein
MSNEKTKRIIKEIVQNEGPLKATELAAKFSSNTSADSLTPSTKEDFFLALDELILEKEILEVEYLLPTSDYRVKSILFPKGTKFPALDAVKNYKETLEKVRVFLENQKRGEYGFFDPAFEKNAKELQTIGAFLESLC